MEEIKKFKKALILGYGREGQSAHKYLYDKFPHLRITIADKKNITPLFPVEDIYSNKKYAELTNESYDLVIRTPVMPADSTELRKVVNKGALVTTAMNIFFSSSKGIKIGVTGTKGKSTTSALTTNLLRRKYKDVRFVGNIGNPVLENSENDSRETLYVVELSSFQLEDLQFSPHIAVILNIYQDHIDHHRNFQNYLKAKGNIIKYQGKNDYLVFNPKNETVAEIAKSQKGKKYTFSQTTRGGMDCYVENGKIYRLKDSASEYLLDLDEIPLLSPANIENTLAAISVANIFNLSKDSIRAGIKSFKSLEHRLEYVGRFKGIDFYNDSLAVNPQAAINALRALPNTETLIAGGFDRELNFEEMAAEIIKTGINNLILFPPTGEKIWKAIGASKQNPTVNKFNVKTMEDAVRFAFEKTSPGKIVLLSPGSPSYGIFEDYRERGDQFKKVVREYSK